MVALLELAGPARQGSAVLGAGRRSPDHVKVALREHGHGLPAADVRADGGARLGVKVKAYYLPSPKARPTDPVPENSSSNRGILVFHVGLEGQPYHRSEGGPAASELQVAEGAFPEGLSMLELLAKEPHVRAVGLSHILVGRVFFDGNKKKRGPTERDMELILGEVQTNARGGKFLPLKGNPVWRSTEPAAVMWEPSAYKDAAGDRVNLPRGHGGSSCSGGKLGSRCGQDGCQAGARHVRQTPD